MTINPTIFKTYDVRGIYPDELDPETAYWIGRAFGKYLKDDLKKTLPTRVVLGQDMRISSPFLAREVARGLNDEGLDVADIGRVPSPAFYHAVAFQDFAGGVMVTASHNPKDYNGFKFCREQAIPIAQGTGLDPEIKNYTLTLAREQPKPVGRGQILTVDQLTARYVEQDLSYLNPAKIKKFRIAADPGNAMGALYLSELFARIPVELIKINWELNGNMPIHEPNPLKLETLQQLEAVIKNEQADLGIATDGDGDRLAFLDEQGDVIPPAIVIGLVAQVLLKKFPGSKIGYDLRSSRVVREMILEAGGKAVETMVGHSLIKAYMKEQDILFSGELSMHYYFRENYYYESPVFVIGQLLLLRSELDKPFSQIWRPYQRYAQSGEINFEVEDKAGMMKKLEKKYADGKISKLDGVKVCYDDWWFSVRPSNTEPVLRLNLEAKDEATMRQKLEEISNIIKEAS